MEMEKQTNDVFLESRNKIKINEQNINLCLVLKDAGAFKEINVVLLKNTKN